MVTIFSSAFSAAISSTTGDVVLDMENSLSSGLKLRDFFKFVDLVWDRNPSNPLMTLPCCDESLR